MAIKIADNLNYAGQKPDFVRQQYDTYEDMKAVKDIAMPSMYIAYCLQDEKVYLYNKTNEIDETFGKFREFTPGGGSDTQVTEMPEATAATVGTILQYVGESDVNYTKGYFYIGSQTPHSETVDITTLEQLTDVIGRSDGVVNVVIDDETTESIQALLTIAKAYFIYNDTIYWGVISDSTVRLSECTPVETDEEVADLNLTETVITYTYGWENVSVSPSGGEPATITEEDINALFE